MKKFAGRNALILALASFMCIALGVFAYLGSDTPEGDRWNPNVVYSTPTPTIPLIATDGWWTTISTPTPQSIP